MVTSHGSKSRIQYVNLFYSSTYVVILLLSVRRAVTWLLSLSKHCGSRLFVSPPTALRLSRVKQVSSLRDEPIRPKKEPAKVGKNLILWMENKKIPPSLTGFRVGTCRAVVSRQPLFAKRLQRLPRCDSPTDQNHSTTIFCVLTSSPLIRRNTYTPGVGNAECGMRNAELASAV